jgi:alkylation response protein AidB-like acyl-CoA dehydrogenase
MTDLSAIAAFIRDRVAPAAPGWALGTAAPTLDLFAGAAALGLMRLNVPVSAGGLGLGFGARAQACRILAATDFGFAMAVVNSHNVALRLATDAAPDLRGRVLPGLLAGRTLACTALTEPSAGSDLGALATTARRQGSGWRLDGAKTWIINARHADWALVYALCDEGPDPLAAFLVDLHAPGVTRAPCDSPLSQHAMGTGALVFHDVALDEGALILPPGIARPAILGELNAARAYVAAMCCGMLAAALAETARWGQSRQTFGKPLAAHQGWRLHLARAATDLAAAEALTDCAVQAVADGVEAQLLAAQAKVHAVAQCQRHLPRLLQAQGAQGLGAHSLTVRHLGAVQAAALTDGAQDILLERIARLAGLSARPRSEPKGGADARVPDRG